MSRLSCHVATTSEKDPEWMQKLSHFVVFYAIPQSPSPLLSIPTLAFFFFPSSPHFHYFFVFLLGKKKKERQRQRQQMADWGPVLVATVLFVLLCPGLLFQIPGRNKVVEFGNMHTSGASIVVHAIIYFGLITIFCIAIGVHIYASQ
ncbi:hypothetical protein ES319_A11G042400v1 [Gossypium barbadense]|uniref:Transmembrane protein n=5 Tax=Gossypium TaxID=3633 RepID=A0A2P5WJD7_GOSBA|nr:hypothetical protein ES319_A11G042400v1 [Gossypium barbadense]PPR91171.1 hypothetical protein GOBAR_AA29526 [Gossypium barbadense]